MLYLLRRNDAKILALMRMNGVHYNAYTPSVLKNFVLFNKLTRNFNNVAVEVYNTAIEWSMFFIEKPNVH